VCPLLGNSTILPAIDLSFLGGESESLRAAVRPLCALGRSSGRRCHHWRPLAALGGRERNDRCPCVCSAPLLRPPA